MSALQPRRHRRWLGLYLAAISLLASHCQAAGTSCEDEVWAQINANKNNLTALQTVNSPAWVSSVEFRGTMDILQSCLLTLLACIYTALHLNVTSESGWFLTLRTKMTWVLIALLAPELVLYVAADQLLQAYRLKKELKKLQEKSDIVDKKFDFDLRYAFLIVMGGVKIASEDLNPLISSHDIGYFHRHNKKALEEKANEACPAFVLTARGAVTMAKRDLWIYVPPSKIDDKSKANTLQKALVIFQVVWMATQCIARRFYSLPLTLLEIHTMVHVVCAIILYLFWFKKPLDVHDPEIFYDDSWLDTIALMLQKSFYIWQSQEMTYCSDQSFPRTTPGDQSSAELGLPTGTLSDQVRLYSSRIYIKKSALMRGIPPQPRVQRLEQELAVLSSADPRPYHMVDELLGCNYDRRTMFTELELSCHNLSATNIGLTFSLPEMASIVTRHPALSALAVLLASAYAGIHLTAWEFEFPSTTENLLWKLACFDIAGTLPLLALLTVGSNRLYFWSLWGFKTNVICKSTRYLFNIIAILVTSAYCISRLFIVVESFISLRHVPIGVYWTPSWLQMIPHV